jgi:hypothetical protein
MSYDRRYIAWLISEAENRRYASYYACSTSTFVGGGLKAKNSDSAATSRLLCLPGMIDDMEKEYKSTIARLELAQTDEQRALLETDRDQTGVSLETLRQELATTEIEHPKIAAAIAIHRLERKATALFDAAKVARIALNRTEYSLVAVKRAIELDEASLPEKRAKKEATMAAYTEFCETNNLEIDKEGLESPVPTTSE